MKQENGRGYIKLILAMTVIAIAIVAVVMYVKNIIAQEEVKNLQADLLLVQAKVEITAGNYNMNKEANPLKGIQLTRITRRY